MRRALLGAFIGLTLMAASGCIKESNGADGKVFKYEVWIPLAIIGVGVAAAPIGLLMVKNSAKYGWLLLIGGPIAAVLMGPGMLASHVTINNERLICRLSLFTFFSSEQTIEFSDVRTVRLTTEESRGRRGRRRINNYLNFDRKGGESIKISADADLMEAAAEELGIVLARNNIPVEDQAQ